MSIRPIRAPTRFMHVWDVRKSAAPFCPLAARWCAISRARWTDFVEVRLYRSLKLQRHRIAGAVDRAADGEPHPAFAHAIFLDVGLLRAVEAHADAALEQGSVVIGTLRIDA